MIVKTKIKSLIEEPITGEWGEEGNGVKVIRTTNFTNEGRLDLREIVERNIPEQKVIKKKLRLGDIILEKSGGSPNQPVGRVVYFDVNGGETYLCNNFTTVLRAKKEVHSRYLFWFLFNQHLTKNTLRFQNKTTGILNLQLDRYLESLQIPYLPFETQQKIASILDKADELRRKDQQLLAKYDELLCSIFYQLSDQANSSSKEVQLSDLISKAKNSARTGPFGSDLLHSEFVGSGVAVLGIDNVVNNVFQWGKERFITAEKYERLKRYRVFPGDVLITIMGTTGRSAVVPESIRLAINTKHLAALTFDKRIANPYFISYSVHSSPFIAYQLKLRNRGAIMEGLNLGIIKELKIKLPPIEAQNKFEDYFKNVTKQKETLVLQSKASDNLFQSLLQKAFKGEFVK